MGPLSLNPALSTEAASHPHPSGNARRDLSTNNNNRPTTGCKPMLSEPEPMEQHQSSTETTAIYRPVNRIKLNPPFQPMHAKLDRDSLYSSYDNSRKYMLRLSAWKNKKKQPNKVECRLAAMTMYKPSSQYTKI